MATSAAALSYSSDGGGGGADHLCCPPHPGPQSDPDSPPVPSGQSLERGHA